MHYTAFPKYHVARFNVGMKIMMSFYLATVLIGLLVAVYFYSIRSNMSYWGAVLHYQGDQAVPEDILAQMEADSGGMLMQAPMSTERVVEILHPHTFSIPLVLLVVAHLFALTNSPGLFKILCYVGSFGGFLGMFGGMFLAPGGDFGIYLLFTSGIVFIASTILMVILPLWAMWFGTPATRDDRDTVRRVRENLGAE
jgi:hypothetical protein